MSDLPYEDDVVSEPDTEPTAADAAAVDALVQDNGSDDDSTIDSPRSVGVAEETRTCESCAGFCSRLAGVQREKEEALMKLETATSMANLLKNAVGGYETRISGINRAHAEALAKSTADYEARLEMTFATARELGAKVDQQYEKIDDLEQEVARLLRRLDELSDAESTVDAVKQDLARSQGMQDEMTKMLRAAAEEKKVMQLEIDQLRRQQDQLGAMISKLKAEEAVWRPRLPELEKKVADLHTENEQHKKCIVHSAARLISDKLHDSHIQRLREMEKSLLAFQERCSEAQK